MIDDEMWTLETVCSFLNRDRAEDVDDWNLFLLLFVGAVPWFRLEPRDGPALFEDYPQLRYYWSEAAFPGPSRFLELRGSELLVPAFTDPGGCVVRPLNGRLRIELSRVRFRGLPKFFSVPMIELRELHPEARETLNEFGVDAGSGAPEALRRATALYAARVRRILEILKACGFDPRVLPQRPEGQKGVKSSVRAAALKEPDLFTASAFEKVWQRMRDDGLIAESE